MKTSDFYYDLPEELIAQTPLANRSDSRLLVLDKQTGAYEHHHFRDLPSFLVPGDRLVLNNTKVLPARLIGHREDSGTEVELLLLKRLSEEDLARIQDSITYQDEACQGQSVYWETLAGPGKRARAGHVLVFGAYENQEPALRARIMGVLPDGNRIVRFEFNGVFEDILDRLGQMPLPPYIHEKLADKNRYQTVYAKEEGSAAAPTAGLHFTKELLSSIEEMGVGITYVTLHVGLGTFRPVKAETIEDHVMHREFFHIDQEAADAINRTKESGHRIIAVGTTSCRTLESAADEHGIIRPCSQETGIFIYPGYKFKVLDGLITNFHLPESTLIMLVSALAGRDNILNAYQEAVRQRYRFFSFGDAMFIH